MVEQRSFSPKEIEPVPQQKILLLGAGSGLGFQLARQLSLDGYQVIAGSRSEQKFDVLSDSIGNAGGLLPLPFIADITDEQSVESAFTHLDLIKGEKVHYFPIAAGGFESVRKGILREILKLKKGDMTESRLIEATYAIKNLTVTEVALVKALHINYKAPLEIFDRLVDEDHIGEDSVIINTSSSLSNSIDPDNLRNYKGPWFYFPVGWSKQVGARALRHEARKFGAQYFDIVAPEIFDTAVGEFIENMADALNLNPSAQKVIVPKVLTRDVVLAITDVLKRGRSDPKEKTLYVTSSGVNNSRPPEWDKSILPYF